MNGVLYRLWFNNDDYEIIKVKRVFTSLSHELVKQGISFPYYDHSKSLCSWCWHKKVPSRNARSCWLFINIYSSLTLRSTAQISISL